MKTLQRTLTTLLVGSSLLFAAGCEKEEIVTTNEAVKVDGDDAPAAVIIPNGLDKDVKKEVAEAKKEVKQGVAEVKDAVEIDWVKATKKDENTQNAVLTVISEPYADELGAQYKKMSAEMKDGDQVLERVHFPYDSDNLGVNDKRTLNQVNAWLKAHPGEKLVLAGHADERGTKEYNEKLAKERAEAVMAYLVKEGVPADRLMAVSYGEKDPLVNADTKKAYRLNRRVTLKKDSTGTVGMYEIPVLPAAPKK